MKDGRIIIIGAGISGLGASFSLRQKGKKSIILEKDETYGGLAGNFTIADGFRFDRFVHLSFSNESKVNDIFEESTNGKIYRHLPNPFNLYKGKWIKHPAQNNLFPLSQEEKEIIISDFRRRPTNKPIDKIKNYEEWLRIQFGNSFAEKFPLIYTKKYWMTEASDLDTKWIGSRLYQPSLEEVLQGASSEDTPITYYAKEMRYPMTGGYKHFLNTLIDGAEIIYKEEVTEIDIKTKMLTTLAGNRFMYDRLISSMPLPKLIEALSSTLTIPKEVKDACDRLRCTSGYLISIALKTTNIPPFLWWYVYDKDILPARVYSPSLKSPDNVPRGCSSLQMEVYCGKDQYTRDELLNGSVRPLIERGIINEEDIIEIDVRFEPWANVIFDHNIYEYREKVLSYVHSLGIETIGRFGLWDYLWSDQALLTGLNIE